MEILKLYEEFSLKLRTEMIWDKELFSELFTHMKSYCIETKMESQIDRNVACVFWNASWWVKQQISGISSMESEYFLNAVTNLDHLAWALFEGENRADSDYEPI